MDLVKAQAAILRQRGVGGNGADPPIVIHRTPKTSVFRTRPLAGQPSLTTAAMNVTGNFSVKSWYFCRAASTRSSRPSTLP
jgi:hypothetical protein